MAQKFSILFLIFSVWWLQVCQSANILCIFPSPSFSHQRIPQALMKALGKRGHNITFFTTDPFETNLTNVEQHSWNSMYQEWNSRVDLANFKENGISPKVMLNTFIDTMVLITRLEMASPAMTDLISSNRTFDVVIVESLGISPFFAFAKHFKAPLIGICSLDAPSMVHKTVGNFYHSIIYPPTISPFYENLTFVQRLIAVGLELFCLWTMSNLTEEHDQIIEQYFGSDMAKSLTLLNDLDFLMYNNHPVLGTVRPIVPASLALGFVHMETPKPLPTDLETFFQQSKNGVIYLSLGSNVKSSQLTQAKVKVLCDAFRKLDYDVLWKWETETFPDKPDNVKIQKWLPQTDILAHEKVKLFITQGGQQSFEEAIHNAVPLLVLPFLIDQFMNAQRAVKLKVGLSLEINTLTSVTLEETLIELLTNVSYKTNMNKLSSLAKDQPMTSLESAVWWTEYVIRNKGAKHLHAKDKDLPFYQYYFLDIAAVGLVLVGLLLKALHLVLKLILSFFVAKSKLGDDKKMQ